MHRPETKIEKEVEILCNKPSQQPKPMKPMHRINWGISCCDTVAFIKEMRLFLLGGN
jgi:hypothetical protein